MRIVFPVILGLLWTGCAIAAPAALYVSSFTDARVLRFDSTTGAPEGVFIAAGSGGLAAPHRVRSGPDGLLYVASADNDSVLRFDATSGAFVDVFIANGGTGTGAGALDYPVDLIFRDGLLYVTSQLNDAVQCYDAATGAFVSSFVGAGSGGLDGPSGMVFGPDGDLFVVGRFSNLVHRYAGATGASLGAFGAGQLAQPYGIAVDAGGTLYVASGNSDTIARFAAASGAFLGHLATAGSGLSVPVGAEIGPDGRFYAASFGTGTVKRFDASFGAWLGDFAASSAGATLSGPNYFTFAPAVFAPAVTTQPGASGNNLLAGAAASFTAAFSGTPAPGVVWQISRDDGASWTDLTDGGAVSGAHTPTLTFSFVSQTLDGARLRAVGSNAAGVATSDPVTLVVAAGTSRLANVSARAFVGTGAQVVIPGTVIVGTGTRRLLIRAIGPTLAEFGVPGALVDPVLEVRRGDESLVAVNDDWSAGSTAEREALIAAMAEVHAFPLEIGTADAAVLLELPAGAYTFVVSGKDEGTGVALVEVYELP